MPQIRFLPAALLVPLDASLPSKDQIGETGSILDRALRAGVAMDHSCGGIAACATCHCYVLEGASSIAPPAADELAMLERAPHRRADSRLACQAVPDRSIDVVVERPPE